ncbi:hypothetical protein P3T76_001225 [Phytophthora citrophthora]|uniref:Uncharacterized protein n=1 Tax=Phytophthora citrophthora TaxID=4793 RepID=A0AAD9GY48_9STRA|nr:hypothetical protein P3T76_001225 [Phytophthora citrophthora]
MKTRKQLSNNKMGRSQSKKTMVKKERVTGGKIKRNNTSSRIVTPAPTEDLDDDCGYGDEFDEVVDESALGQLI